MKSATTVKKSILIIAMLMICGHARGEFTPIVGWDSQVFPSYLVATAAMKNQAQSDPTVLGDAYGIFGVSIKAPADNTAVHVSVQCDGYSEASEYVGVLAKAGETYRIYPKMRYRFERLSQCRQATPSTTLFKVRIGNGTVEELACTVTMHSINDCPFAIVEDEKIATDLSHIYAAYVNEQHPYVDKLLREALDQGMVDSFTGYQSKSKDQVLAQVYALWDLMVTRDMRYSSTTATAASSQSARSQHVRLLEQTVNNTQANCVDGTVLFAALLRKIGIDSALAITEDHCYLAFWTDADHRVSYGLETTFISQQAEEVTTPAELENVVAEETRWDVSWGSFVSALNKGTESLQDSLKKKPSDITLIDIDAARAAGVLPIPFTSNEHFVAIEVNYDEESEEEYESSEEDSSEQEEVNEEDGSNDLSSWTSRTTPHKQS